LVSPVIVQPVPFSSVEQVVAALPTVADAMYPVTADPPSAPLSVHVTAIC
jgi:hypothetical protein